MAAIVGLEALTKPCEVELYSDSKYVVDAINQNWLEGWVVKNWKLNTKNPVKNIDLWKQFSCNNTMLMLTMDCQFKKINSKLS